MKNSNKRCLLNSLILVLVSGLLAAVLNLVRPSGAIPWVGDWDHYIETKALKEGIPLASLEQTRQMAEEGLTIVLDARPLEEYDAGHIPGAVALPYDAVDEYFPDVQIMLVPDQPILAYCSGKACDDSFELILFLREQGYTNVVLFAAGFNEWKKNQYPVEGGP
jgi:rhodanese-related sulfurtransferase